MFTRNFKQLNYKDVDIAGGKGASLGEMTQASIQIPPGFVVLANAFDEFIIKTKHPKGMGEANLNVAIKAELDKVNYDDIKSVERTSGVIRHLIHGAKMTEILQKEILIEFKKLDAKYVAVRSSATAEDSSIASWAGELESYLDTTETQLLENIKRCWSSLFTPRAIFYRQEKGLLNTKVSVAVVIQQMIESEVSGIAFSVHPITKDSNQMIIEAGWGLGEAIVSGQVTPDSYVITKDDLAIIDINISAQEKMIVRKKNGGVEHATVKDDAIEDQKLTGAKIIELANECIEIENHYNKPQDIEWAYYKNKFYITQSRPITTL